MLTPPDPIYLEGPGTIRWAAGCPDGRRSLTWLVTGAKNSDDVYIGTRSMMKDMKLSLHPSRWRMALTTQAAARHLPEGSDRVLARWEVPTERWPGWRLAAVILTPATTFSTPFHERRPSDGSPILWFPAPPPPEHLRFYVLLGEPDAGLTINNVIGDVGRMTLGSGLRVWVVADSFTVTAEHQRHIDDIRRAMAQHPDAAAGWVWGEVEGVPNLLDLAALGHATAGASGAGDLNYLARVRLDPAGGPAMPLMDDDAGGDTPSVR